MNTVLATATVFLVGAVGWGSICRLRLVQTKTHKRVWVEAYYLMGVYAASELYYLVEDGPRLSAVLGLATLACFLWGTRSTWRVKAPDGLLKEKA